MYLLIKFWIIILKLRELVNLSEIRLTLTVDPDRIQGEIEVVPDVQLMTLIGTL